MSFEIYLTEDEDEVWEYMASFMKPGRCIRGITKDASGTVSTVTLIKAENYKLLRLKDDVEDELLDFVYLNGVVKKIDPAIGVVKFVGVRPGREDAFIYKVRLPG